MSEPLQRSNDQMFCRQCGNVIFQNAEICPKCGVRQLAPPSATGRNRTTAAIFAFLLGGLGAHKFYLGNTGLGILYLFLCWTFIPAIVALVEGIQYLGMTDQAFQQKYGAP